MEFGCHASVWTGEFDEAGLQPAIGKAAAAGSTSSRPPRGPRRRRTFATGLAVGIESSLEHIHEQVRDGFRRQTPSGP
ncbi:MAG: hypothetical protein JWR64_1725 [Marmoricola sp.]|jgi:hypothetical protein|nr:hypothetical protein [Marmoricola sp.]